MPFNCILLGLSFLMSFASGAWAQTTQCFSPEYTRFTVQTLQETVQLRQAMFDLTQEGWEAARGIEDIVDRLKLLRATKRDFECMGFEVRFKKVHSSLHEELLGELGSAFFLLDDSMYPAALRAGDTRPDYIGRKIGRVIKIIDRYRYIKNAAASYNSLNKNIVYPLRAFDSRWGMRVRSFQLPTRERYTTHGEWESWDCERRYSLYAGSFGIFLHEYGHDLDFALRRAVSGGKFSSRTKGWKKLHQAEFTSPYGKTSAVEDFAETFSAYLLDPLLKCYAPGKYNWFSRFVKINEEIYGSEKPYADVNCEDVDLRELVMQRAVKERELKSCGEK